MLLLNVVPLISRHAKIVQAKCVGMEDVTVCGFPPAEKNGRSQNRMMQARCGLLWSLGMIMHAPGAAVWVNLCAFQWRENINEGVVLL